MTCPSHAHRWLSFKGISEERGQRPCTEVSYSESKGKLCRSNLQVASMVAKRGWMAPGWGCSRTSTEWRPISWGLWPPKSHILNQNQAPPESFSVSEMMRQMGLQDDLGSLWERWQGLPTSEVTGTALQGDLAINHLNSSLLPFYRCCRDWPSIKSPRCND